MHMFWVVAAALSVAVYAVAGIVAVVSEWVPPLARRRVLYSRMWGYGGLLASAGLGLFLFMGPLAHSGVRDFVEFFPLVGWLLFMGGMLIQLAAQRPRRGATKSAS